MELLNIISDYIKQEDTDYAILINGGWGSGKTFFLKNTIGNKITEIPPNKTDKKAKKYELVYISLYGITTIDELKEKLLVEVNQWLKHPINKWVDTGLNIGKGFIGGKVDKSIKNEVVRNIWGGIPKNKVLVFDDLERLSTNTLKEVLGFLNTYTEHQGLKVIILADETKIPPSQKAEYDSYKEKIVRFTYLFDPNLSEVYESFLARYAEAFQSYSKRNKDNILRPFMKSKYANLRTLRFVLDLHSRIFEELKGVANLKEEYFDFIIQRFWFFLASYAITYKKGATAEELRSLEELSSDLENPHVNRALAKMITEGIEKEQGESEPQIEPIKTFKDKFEEEFLEDESTGFEFFDFIQTFIHSGDLRTAELSACAEKIKSVLLSQELKPEWVLLKKFNEILYLEDGELGGVVQELMTYVSGGVFPLESYPNIFESLSNYAKYRFEGVTVDGGTVRVFQAAMDIAGTRSKYVPDMDRRLRFYSSGDPLVSEIRNYVFRVNASLETNEQRDLARKMFAQFEAGKSNEFLALLNAPENIATPIFKPDYINPDDFFGRFLSLPNGEKNDFSQGLMHGQRYATQNYNLREERDFFIQFRDVIDGYLGSLGSPKQISTNIIEHFRGLIDEHLKAIP